MLKKITRVARQTTRARTCYCLGVHTKGPSAVRVINAGLRCSPQAQLVKCGHKRLSGCCFWTGGDSSTVFFSENFKRMTLALALSRRVSSPEKTIDNDTSYPITGTSEYTNTTPPLERFCYEDVVIANHTLFFPVALVS